MMKDHTSSHLFSCNNESTLATKGPNSQHFDSQGYPTGRGVITIIELITLKKPIGKFMGNYPIGKVT